MFSLWEQVLVVGLLVDLLNYWHPAALCVYVCERVGARVLPYFLALLSV